MASRCARREQIARDEKIDAPLFSILAIKGHLCFRCLKPSKDMKKCDGCKRLSYCSKACQALDWRVWHKPACKALKLVNYFEEGEIAKSRTWPEYHQYITKLFLTTGFYERPTDLANFIRAQPYCSTCHRSAANMLHKTTLKPCQKCHMVFTCEECRPRHSDNDCTMYQEFVEGELFTIQNFEEGKPMDCKLPTEVPMQIYQPLSSAKNWFEYYTNVSDKRYIRMMMLENFEVGGNGMSPADKIHVQMMLDQEFGHYSNDLHQSGRFYEYWKMMNDHFTSLANGLDPTELQGVKTFRNALWNATKISSMPLTILAALEDCLPDIADRKYLNLHLIGAKEQEWQELMVFEELLHLLPSLQHLNLVLIGPEMHLLFDKTVELGCCPACQSRHRRRTFEGSNEKYHDFAKLPKFKKPDLAVMFHSDRTKHDQSSWLPTTKFLLDSSILTLCTTFGRDELREEVAELEGMKAKFVVPPGENIWRSLVMELDFTPQSEHSMYHHNHFRYVFQGKLT